MTPPTSGTAFYCVADDRYFLGAVAMINSLRLQGHEEPVHVLDLGLTGPQRELLAAEADLIRAPRDRAPHLLKTVAPLAAPAETMVLIDTDMIVTRPLGELIERARAGMVVAFRNHEERHDPEWGELLGLGELERRPYLSSGLIAFAAADGTRILTRMAALQDAVEFERTFWRSNEPGYAFLYADQDVFNAVLAAEVEAERVLALDRRLGAPLIWDDPELVDERTLRCRYGDDGSEPYVLHHLLPAKPWMRPMYEGVYSVLLRRLLDCGDVAIRVPAAMIPRRLRNGRLGRLERGRVAASVRVRWAVGTRVDRYRFRRGLPPRDPIPRP